jgi:multiple sugar transport system permease protein
MVQPPASVSATQRQQKRALWVSILIYAVLGLWALVCLFPLYWVTVTSFKGEPEIIGGPYYLPFVDFTPSLNAWVSILTYSNDHLLSRFYNSVDVGIASTVLTV